MKTVDCGKSAPENSILRFSTALRQPQTFITSSPLSEGNRTRLQLPKGVSVSRANMQESKLVYLPKHPEASGSDMPASTVSHVC